MRRRIAVTALAPAALIALLLIAGCGESGTEIVTFTDAHGRVCTAVVDRDSGDEDIDVGSLQCEYPPEDRTPGPAVYQTFPSK